ncbi:uncharacterized protein LOC112341716 [Selaginella moellendorffii]|uniref:uncharacterized protein LOC112341716 n=1 Tax=Selaginella moellendorffii TaxID=88036 RepID=UPI000D1CF389|nr:uncharacterized protein LOC112341716 [Selaginella moellendorffii]|eukprot:XP_024518079.1 uncharacterized protein LOC112341716 [Selaginella moellendorffii]
MKFNHDPPICQRCETCGGPDHCGETCSALEAVTHSGFPLCRTLGFPSTTTYSLIDKRKPEQGLIVDMVANTSQDACSFSVSVYCKRTGQQELPTSVSGDGCHYRAVLKHPAGCPVVTRLDGGGLGWFSTLLIVLLCFLVVYMIAATIYRRKALGIVGVEAIPHMDFWRSIPSNIQWGVEYVIGKVTGLYRRVTEPSYMRVNE